MRTFDSDSPWEYRSILFKELLLYCNLRKLLEKGDGRSLATTGRNQKRKQMRALYKPKRNSYTIMSKDQQIQVYLEPTTEIFQSAMNFSDIEQEYFYLWPSPQVFMNIDCLDRRYIVLQEKTQYSLSQLVSQIGGDLGLYVGFSMISILEAVLFFVSHVSQPPRGHDAT